MQMVKKNLPKKRGDNMELNMGALNILLREKFNGNQAEMARKLGISKYQLNIIINTNGTHAGKKVFGAILKYCKVNNYNYEDYIFLT